MHSPNSSMPPGPGQSDFGRIDVSTVKDALGSMHGTVDHCPIAMQLKKPAAVDGPYEAGATEIVEGPLGRTTEPKPSRPSLVGRHARPNFPRGSGSFCSRLRTAANGAEGRHWADDQGQDRRPPGPNRLEWDRDVLARYTLICVMD